MTTGAWLAAALATGAVVVVVAGAAELLDAADEAAVPVAWLEEETEAEVAAVLESMEVLEPASPVRTPKMARPPVPAAPVASWMRRRALRRREAGPYPWGWRLSCWWLFWCGSMWFMEPHPPWSNLRRCWGSPVEPGAGPP